MAGNDATRNRRQRVRNLLSTAKGHVNRMDRSLERAKSGVSNLQTRIRELPTAPVVVPPPPSVEPAVVPPPPVSNARRAPRFEVVAPPVSNTGVSLNVEEEKPSKRRFNNGLRAIDLAATNAVRQLRPVVPPSVPRAPVSRRPVVAPPPRPNANIPGLNAAESKIYRNLLQTYKTRNEMIKALNTKYRLSIQSSRKISNTIQSTVKTNKPKTNGQNQGPANVPAWKLAATKKNKPKRAAVRFVNEPEPVAPVVPTPPVVANAPTPPVVANAPTPPVVANAPTPAVANVVANAPTPAVANVVANAPTPAVANVVANAPTTPVESAEAKARRAAFEAAGSQKGKRYLTKQFRIVNNVSRSIGKSLSKNKLTTEEIDTFIDMLRGRLSGSSSRPNLPNPILNETDSKLLANLMSKYNEPSDILRAIQNLNLSKYPSKPAEPPNFSLYAANKLPRSLKNRGKQRQKTNRNRKLNMQARVRHYFANTAAPEQNERDQLFRAVATLRLPDKKGIPRQFISEELQDRLLDRIMERFPA